MQTKYLLRKKIFENLHHPAGEQNDPNGTNYCLQVTKCILGKFLPAILIIFYQIIKSNFKFLRVNLHVMNDKVSLIFKSLEEYLVSEEKNKKVYHIPEDVAVRCDLANIRKHYPQTTLRADNGTPYNVLIIE